MTVRFDWDEDKAETNVRKHDVSFEEAIGVFADPFAVTSYDAHHSNHEERWIDVGKAMSGRLLVVVYTERGNCIRVISARKAQPAERRLYEQQAV